MSKYIVAVDTLVLRDPENSDNNRYVQIDDEGDFWISSNPPNNDEAQQILIRKDQLAPFIKLLQNAGGV